MKNHEKIISVILALIVAFSMIPATVCSAAIPDSVDEIEPIYLNQSKWAKVEELDGDQYYRFTPEESGWYRFYTNGATDDVSLSLRDSDMNHLKSSYTEYSNGYEINDKYRFEAGETYVFVLKGYSAYFEFTISDDLVRANSLEFSRGESGAFPENYSFRLDTVFYPENAVPEEITWSSSEESVATVDQLGNVSCISAGETAITATSENGLSAEYRLKVKQIIPLFTGVPKTVDVTAYQQTDSFLFTPEESGSYRIGPHGGYGIFGIHVYDSDGSFIGIPYDELNGFMDITLNAGETYELSVSTGNAYSDIEKYTILAQRLVKATGITIEQGESFEAFEKTRENFSSKFIPDNAASESCTWSLSDERVATVDEYGHTRFLAPGQTTLTVTSQSGLTASCAVTVKEILPLSLNEEKSFELSSSQAEMYYSFTPEESGTYALSVKSVELILSASVRDEDMYYLDSVYDGDPELRYYLEAGKTYYYVISKDSSYTFKGDVSVVLQRVPDATGIVIEQGESYEAFEKSSVQFYSSFIPENAVEESCTWSLSDERVATIDESGYATFLTTGQTTVTVTSQKGLTASCAVTVKEIPSISLQEKKNVDYFDDQGKMYYSFTPEESGLYSLDVSSDDTYSETLLYDGDMMRLTMEYGLNYNVPYIMEAGKTYYYSVMHLYSDRLNVTISVNRYTRPVGLELVSPPDKTEYIEELLYDDLNYSGMKVRIQWEDGTDTLLDFDNNPYKVGFYYVYTDVSDTGLLTVQYGDLSITYQLDLIENPVDYIKIDAVPKSEFIYADPEYSYRSYSWDETGEDTYVWSYDFYGKRCPEGLEFTVYYNDGTSKKYTWEDIELPKIVGKNYQTIDGHVYSFGAYGNEMKVGENTVTLRYMNHTAEYTVTVKPSGVESVEIISAPDNAAYDMRYGSPDWKGLSFRLRYEDGSTKDFTPDEFEYQLGPGCTFTAEGMTGKIEYGYYGDDHQNGRYFLRCFDKSAPLDLSMAELSADKAAVDHIDVEEFSYETGHLKINVSYEDGTVESITSDDPVYKEHVGPVSYLWFARYSRGLFNYEIRKLTESKYTVRAFGKTVTLYTSGTKLLGDVDGDGAVTNVDATVIQRHLSEIPTAAYYEEAADADGDGSVTLMDASYIQKWLIKSTHDDNIGQPIV